MEEKVLEVLEELNIDYKMVEHEALFTVAQSSKVDKNLEGIGCKTLFLKDKELNYYLYVIRGLKRADLKAIALNIKSSRLSFGNEEELYEKIGVRPGSVSPFGIINDVGLVKVLIDNELVDNKIIIHPNVNTLSVSIDCKDLIKVINYKKNNYYIV